MFLADWLIRQYSINSLHYGDWGPMISPFTEASNDKNAISYGLTSAGYDLRLGTIIYKFKNDYGIPIDPKRFHDKEYVEKVTDKIELTEGTPYILPPHSYILGTSVEYFKMPRFLSGEIIGKSTYARSTIFINTTPIEPEWEGNITIEIGNLSPCHALIYPMEGIAQIRFMMIQGEVETSYKDKKGKYQAQKGVTLPRMKEE